MFGMVFFSATAVAVAAASNERGEDMDETVSNGWRAFGLAAALVCGLIAVGAIIAILCMLAQRISDHFVDWRATYANRLAHSDHGTRTCTNGAVHTPATTPLLREAGLHSAHTGGVGETTSTVNKLE